MKKLCSYLFISLCSFFIFSISKLNADVTYYDYDYDSQFVIDNYDSRFFGENGYLEKLRTNIINRSFPWAIVFTKDDLCVYQPFINNYGDVELSKFIFYQGDLSSYRFYFNFGFSTSSYKSVYCLHSYSSFELMYNDFVNGVSPTVKEFSLLNDLTSTKSNFDSNFNDIQVTFDDYVFPYFYNGDTSYFSVCSHLNINGTKYNGTNDVCYTLTQTYYKIYGYDPPGKIYTNIKSIDGLADGVGSSFSVSFETGKKPQLAEFRIYGKVFDNDNTYHWEDISPIIHRDSYCAFDYTDSYVNGTYGLNFNVETCSNIDSYDLFYVKAIFKETVKAYHINDYNNVLINDVSHLLIFDKINFTYNSTTIFSTTLDNYDYGFYYTKYKDTTAHARSNDIGIVNLETGKSNGELITIHESNLYHGNFTSVINPIHKGISAYNSYMVNYKSYFHYLVTYMYRPVDSSGNPIIYVSKADLDEDFNFSASIIDGSGNLTSGSFSRLNELYNSDLNSDLSGLSGLFRSFYSKASSFIDCSIEILSLVTSLFNSFPVSVQALIILIFIISLVYVFIRFIC